MSSLSPFRLLLVGLEIFGFLILVFQVLRSSEPLSFKLAVVIFPLIALYTVLVLQLGRCLGRKEIDEKDGEA
jgi:hypothetical protein